MKKWVTLAVLAICSFRLFSQTAPDFTITATDGQTHHLYADYLDQGMTVVLDIMFTTCPPCNTFAPFMEPLYQLWGAGAYDVEFFSLSNKNFDDNTDVGNWLAGHGISLPGAGSDGGALAAVSPYESGQFGPYYGAPTFVVIAPDGTVQFNVGLGLAGQAKADAISAAIAAAGALLPPVQVDIQGNIKTPDGDPVGKVKLSVLPGFPEIYQTGNPGTFHFTPDLQPEISYKLFAEKNINPSNGVTTFDLVLISRHILGIDPLTTIYELIAADLNNSGSVTTFDAVVGRRIILGIDTVFANNKSWRFLKAGCNSGCPLDTVLTFLSEDDLTNISIIGVKIGDVNFSANGSNLAGEGDDKALAEIYFSEKNEWLEQGETAAVVFQAGDLQGMSGTVIHLEMKASLIDFEELVPGVSLLEERKAKEGVSVITIRLPKEQLIALPGNRQLFRLKIQTDKKLKVGDAIRLK